MQVELRRALRDASEKMLEASIDFGICADSRWASVARKLFGAFHLPLMRVVVTRTAGEWVLSDIRSRCDRELSMDDKRAVLERAEEYLLAGAPRRRIKSYRYDLAILWNPKAEDSPSNRGALSKFEQAADQVGLRPVRITAEDYGRIPEFDGLFNRETTAVEHHTYRFAQRAALEGLVVVDDPESILRCSNKVFLAELLVRHRVAHPRTWVLAKSTFASVEPSLPVPCVLKPPDGCFSQGIVKIRDRKDFASAVESVFARSELILAQVFVPTAYDWRIGVLDGRPLYACRYYMAKDHWQIIKRDTRGREREGAHETMNVEEAPRTVVQAARRA